MTRKEITEYMIDGLLHVVEYLRQTHPDTTKTARREIMTTILQLERLDATIH